MKYPLLSLFSIVFFSCSNPLEKTYDKVGLAKDLIELKAIVSEDKLNELEGYIAISTRVNIKEILNQRLQNHICDDYILEMNKKGIHKHNERNNSCTVSIAAVNTVSSSTASKPRSIKCCSKLSSGTYVNCPNPIIGKASNTSSSFFIIIFFT
jgi:hypothetical protein